MKFVTLRPEHAVFNRIYLEIYQNHVKFVTAVENSWDEKGYPREVCRTNHVKFVTDLREVCHTIHVKFVTQTYNYL